MRSISEQNLAMVIPLLAAKIRDIRKDLGLMDEGRGEDDGDDRFHLQELLHHYGRALRTLGDEYQTGFDARFNLPSYEDLIRDPVE